MIVSPDELNRFLRTALVVPLASRVRSYRYRPSTDFHGTEGQAALAQVRAVDKSRLRRRLGKLSAADCLRLSGALRAFVADEAAT